MKNRRFYLLPLVCILLISMLNACGFKLRGALELSPDMSPLYLQQNSLFELARQIKPLLAANEIKLTENEHEANAYLTLNSEQKKRNVLSVDSNGRAREYLLSYTVLFSITIKSATALKAKDIEQSISISRSLLFDPDAVLAVTNESEILYKDMQRDAAQLILLKMQAHSKNSEAADKVNKIQESNSDTAQ